MLWLTRGSKWVETNMDTMKKSLREILRYPSAVVGIVIISLLVITAIYTVITIPYNKAISLWRGGEDVWYKNPKFAPPAWINIFQSKKLPVSLRWTAPTGR